MTASAYHRTLTAAAAGLLLATTARAGEPPGRWPAEKANQWYATQPWLVGCNFLPSTAVNDVEMWQADSFDPQTIDRELGWARGLGFNTVRVFINYVVWKADAQGLKKRLDQFLAIAGRHGIKVMVILLDDCFKQDPKVGKQLPPEPGVHNSQWVASPGAGMVKDPRSWDELEKYVNDMVKTFAHDRRIVVWDLYNEPSQSLPLVESVFHWARQARPDQPLTTCVYGGSCDPKRLAELSDVISFHCYGPLPDMKSTVQQLAAHRRPLLCTEWMARTGGSRFETHLPYLKQQKVACWNWGLVAGRTQTYFPWGSPKGAAEPKVWHHDILHADGTPFSEREVRVIRATTGAAAASATRP
jgi:endo-1,4-beta-mannosidase